MQYCEWLAYPQLPAPLHVPGESYTVMAFASVQYEAGGVEHVFPAHGSPLHTLLLQPKLQYWTCAGYAHAPALHEAPAATYAVRWVESEQYGAGGVLQLTPTHGSPLHLPDAQPSAHATSDGAY